MNDFQFFTKSLNQQRLALEINYFKINVRNQENRPQIDTIVLNDLIFFFLLYFRIARQNIAHQTKNLLFGKTSGTPGIGQAFNVRPCFVIFEFSLGHLRQRNY